MKKSNDIRRGEDDRLGEIFFGLRIFGLLISIPIVATVVAILAIV